MLPLALTLASLAISVSGRSANSSCPEVIVETSTIDEASTVYGELQYSTLSETLTFETTLANYTRTTTLTRTPDAHTITKTTGTSTALDPTSTTYTYECTTNSTMYVWFLIVILYTLRRSSPSLLPPVGRWCRNFAGSMSRQQKGICY
jgi:hypothetical protein